MTPEQLQEFNSVKEQLAQVVAFINKLESPESIPLEFNDALKERLGGFRTETTSVSVADVATQAVSEGGSSSYSVAKLPSGVRAHKVDGGTTIYIPYYT